MKGSEDTGLTVTLKTEESHARGGKVTQGGRGRILRCNHRLWLIEILGEDTEGGRSQEPSPEKRSSVCPRHHRGPRGESMWLGACRVGVGWTASEGSETKGTWGSAWEFRPESGTLEKRCDLPAPGLSSHFEATLMTLLLRDRCWGADVEAARGQREVRNS